MKAALQFVQHFSWPFGLCGGAYTIVRLFVPEMKISIQVLLAVVTVACAVFITLVGYITRDRSSLSGSLVVGDIRDAGSTFVIERTANLSAGMGVQVYIKDGSFEELIGTGRHIHTQTDGAHQIRMIYDPRVSPERLGQIIENSSILRKSLVVKTGVLIEKESGAAQ